MPNAANEFDIMLDGQPVRVTGPTISGAQLKAAAGRDAVYQLFLESSGNEPDQLIADQQALVINDRMQFYTVPPALMGNLWGR
jgi:hypothetical protein